MSDDGLVHARGGTGKYSGSGYWCGVEQKNVVRHTARWNDTTCVACLQAGADAREWQRSDLMELIRRLRPPVPDTEGEYFDA